MTTAQSTAAAERSASPVDTGRAPGHHAPVVVPPPTLASAMAGVARSRVIRQRIAAVKGQALEPRSEELLLDEVERLRTVLTRLEEANEDLAAGRSHCIYLAMLDDGQEEALLALDAARAAARAVLADAPVSAPTTNAQEPPTDDR